MHACVHSHAECVHVCVEKKMCEEIMFVCMHACVHARAQACVGVEACMHALVCANVAKCVPVCVEKNVCVEILGVKIHAKKKLVRG